MNTAIKIYSTLTRSGIFFVPLALLALRLGWGWELFESGKGHLGNLGATTEFFKGLGIPLPRLNAIVSGWTEALGGILIMAGLATRLIAVPVFFNFCVAYWMDARDQVKHVFSNPDKFIDYTAYPFLLLALLMMTVGPGLLSFDGLLKKTVFRKHARPDPLVAYTIK